MPRKYLPKNTLGLRFLSKGFFLAAIIAAATLFAASLLASSARAQGKPLVIPLHSAETGPFIDFQPPLLPELKPAFKEKKFPLSEAVNWKELNALVGPLTEEQRAYLTENRFLLLPKPQFLLARPEKSFPADEMLGNFDGLGGSLREGGQRPENARLIGPDVVLHAFHSYISTRREAVEAGPLRENAHLLLSFLMENARQIKKGALKSGSNWEKLMAQLVVPLIILENCAETDEENVAGQDSLENALAAFERYRTEFSPAMAQNIRGELRRVYQASSREVSLLGLHPVEGGPEISYQMFKPEGRYARLSSSRAYFRAMVWLKDLGWDGQSESGLACAINFALALSYVKAGAGPADEPVGAAENSGGATILKREDAEIHVVPRPHDARSAWVRQVEIESFFQGHPSGFSYQQWLAFLMKESEVPEFTADSGADREIVGRLKLAMLNPSSAQEPAGRKIITVLPKPVKLTGLLSDYLSQGEGVKENLPLMFSSLWLPAMWGNKAALEMLPRQAALSVAGRKTEGLLAEDKGGPSFLNARLEFIANWLASPDRDKAPSLALARLRLSGALFSEFGPGYPAYMRQNAFQVKRIESAGGLLAEMVNESPSLSKTLAGASAPESKKAEKESAPQSKVVVKGFVEPDLAFWAEMIRLVGGLRGGYIKYGLFPDDLGKSGHLSRFAKRLERCYDLSVRELRGEDLTRDDYEFIRLFSLDWMALSPGDPGGRRPLGFLRSALVSEIRTVPALIEQGQGVVIYEATGEPWLMLALVGNENSPRLVVGLTFNHYEFAGPQGRRLTDEAWRKAVYGRYSQAPPPEGLHLPAKNFWYTALQP